MVSVGTVWLVLTGSEKNPTPPWSSVTVTEALKSPWLVYRWVTTLPVAVAPSPNVHA